MILKKSIKTNSLNRQMFAVVIIIIYQYCSLNGQNSISKLSTSIYQYKSIQKELNSLELKYKTIRDTCWETSKNMPFLVTQIQNEVIKISNEFRQGLYCSECKRPKSQIEKEEKVSFEEHLSIVKGKAIPFTEVEIKKAVSPLENKIIEIKNSAKNKCDIEEKTRREISDKVTLAGMLRLEISQHFSNWKIEKGKEIEELRQKTAKAIVKEDKIINSIVAEGLELWEKLIKMSEFKSGSYCPMKDDGLENIESSIDQINKNNLRNSLITQIKDCHHKLLNAKSENLVNHQARLESYNSIYNSIKSEGESIRKLSKETMIRFEYVGNVTSEFSKNLNNYYVQKALTNEIDTYENGYKGYELGEKLYDFFRSQSDVKYKQEKEINELDSRLSSIIGQYRLFIN